MKPRNIAWRARPLGYLLLVGGCLASAHYYCRVDGPTHLLWIRHSQQLPAGELIPRTEAVAALREFQLEANWIFRNRMAWPTAAMFAGGLILGIGKNKNQDPPKPMQAVAGKPGSA